MCAYYVDNAGHLAPWEPARPPGFLTPEYHARWVEQRQMTSDRGSDYSFLAYERGNEQRIVAIVNLHGVVRGVYHGAILGYSLDARYEGRGLARESVAAVIGFAFGELALHRLSANYQPTNVRSGGLLRRLGFTVEGYARDYLYMNGAWRDHVLTSLTNPAWMPPERPI